MTKLSQKLQSLLSHSRAALSGIGKLLFGAHSSKSLHCFICPNINDHVQKQPFTSLLSFVLEGAKGSLTYNSI